MSNLKLLYKILRLKGMKITRFWFKNRNKELHLTVKPYKNGCRCPECGRRGRIVRQTTECRQWEDITLMGMKVLLWYTPKEIDCPTHGRLQEAIPWAPAHTVKSSVILLMAFSLFGTVNFTLNRPDYRHERC